MPIENPGTSGRVIQVLTGCTAVGKTELALRWAERHDAEILSCDSLLFYRGMDIGTAKPSPGELARVPHHLIDVCGVTDQMDITRYIAAARAAAEGIIARGSRVLVAGGSGFYLKSFFAPVADEVEVPPEIRVRVRDMEPAAVLGELRSLNPGGLGKLDTANPRRVVRALERCLASGRTVVELADAFARQPSAFADWDLRLVRIELPKEDLAGRIERRVREMLAAGLVDEVRRLVALGLEKNPSAAGAIGYREVLAMFRGEVERGDLQTLICANTQALVKKQRTWFRTQLPAHEIVDPRTAVVDALFEPRP